MARRGTRPSSARGRSCAPARRGAASAARSSATVRTVLMPGSASRRRARRPVPVASASASQSGSSSGVRSATAVALAGDGLLVAAGDRAGQRALGPRAAAQFSTAARTSGTSARAVDAGGRGEPLGGALERDEEVRGDRGRGVVGGAVARRRPRPGACRGASASVLGGVQRARRGAGHGGGWRRRSWRRRSGTVISGCRREGLVPGQGASVVAPEQWPTSAAGRDAGRGGGAISPSGTHSSTTSAPAPSAPRPSGPCDRDPPASRRRSASARPRRPRPTIATEDPSCIGAGPSSK